MKIIFIIPNLGAGGAERVISILSDSFSGKSMNVDVILLQDNTISYSISDKVNTVYFDMNLLSCSKKLSCKILRDYFKKQNLICISDVDTRALVSYIRDNGAMNAVISTDGKSIEELKALLVDGNEVSY